MVAIVRGDIEGHRYAYDASACGPSDDPKQCDALQQLALHTDVQHWKLSANWLRGGTFCAWYGVSCDGNGDVVKLCVRPSNAWALSSMLPLLYSLRTWR